MSNHFPISLRKTSNKKSSRSISHYPMFYCTIVTLIKLGKKLEDSEWVAALHHSEHVKHIPMPVPWALHISNFLSTFVLQHCPLVLYFLYATKRVCGTGNNLQQQLQIAPWQIGIENGTVICTERDSDAFICNCHHNISVGICIDFWPLLFIVVNCSQYYGYRWPLTIE